MGDQNAEELKRQIEALQQENQRLKRQGKPIDSDELVVTEGDYNGYPTLSFQRGNKKPFNVGLKKLQAVVEARETVEQFIKKHSDTAEEADVGKDDQI